MGKPAKAGRHGVLRGARRVWVVSNAADGFLATCGSLASLAGEARLYVENADPELADRVQTALRWVELWSPDIFQAIPLEVGPYSPPASRNRVAGSLLSGGIDSLAMLCTNHLLLPEGHPARIETCVIVNWNAGAETTKDRAAFDSVETKKQWLEVAAKDARVGLISLHSNAMSLFGYPRARYWGEVVHGIAFGGAANTLAGGLHTMFIAAGDPLEGLLAWGSHPLIDNELSTTNLRFAHTGLKQWRTEKAGIVANWPAGLDSITVCTADYETRAAMGNCGSCEKCVRTALQIAAFGKLDQAATFRRDDITPEKVRTVSMGHRREGELEDLAVRLREVGEVALGDALGQRSRRIHQRDRYGGFARRIDRSLFGGRLLACREGP